MITLVPRSSARFSLSVGLMAALLAAPVMAGSGAGPPILRIQWWVDGNEVANRIPLGSDNGNGTWSYVGSGMDPLSGVIVHYTINADADPLMSLGLAVENTTGISSNLIFSLQLEIVPDLPEGTRLAGSVALGVTTDSAGGAVSTLPGFDVWRGLIDGVTAVAVFDDGFSLTLDGTGSAGASGNFGLDVPLDGPPANATIGVAIAFSLTPFDQSSMTSVFSVTEPPAAPPAGGPNTFGGNTGMRRVIAHDYKPPLSQLDGMLPIRTSDIDDDGLVGMTDLLSIIQSLGPCSDRALCPADVSGNGMVAIEDLLLLIRAWG